QRVGGEITQLRGPPRRGRQEGLGHGVRLLRCVVPDEDAQLPRSCLQRLVLLGGVKIHRVVHGRAAGGPWISSIISIPRDRRPCPYIAAGPRANASRSSQVPTTPHRARSVSTRSSAATPAASSRSVTVSAGRKRRLRVPQPRTSTCSSTRNRSTTRSRSSRDSRVTAHIRPRPRGSV